MDKVYDTISKVESPFPFKPMEPNYFNGPHPGKDFQETDNRVYPEKE